MTLSTNALAIRGFLAIAVLLGSALSVGCQTSRFKSFGEVKEGMGKDEVIAAAGPPNRSRRWQGKDRWIYQFPNANQPPTIREVHFQDGHVVYVGSRVEADVPAEQQDVINAKIIADDRARDEQHEQARLERLNSFQLTSAGSGAAEAEAAAERSEVPQKMRVAPMWEPLQ
jgi:outer membrane protein assembly factor BamE (lipoprotein component of BamABCDE complex)